MERGIKMTVTMEFTELIFKDDSKLLVRYDAGTNVPLLYGYHNDYVAEFFGRLYKCVTDPIFLISVTKIIILCGGTIIWGA